MALGELVKVADHKGSSVEHGRRVGAAGKLKRHAFLQVAGAHSRRIHGLYYAQGFFELAGFYENSERESQVVDYVDQLAAQVAVVVQRADEVLAQGLLLGSQRAQGELLVKHVAQVHARDNGRLVGFVVGRIVVGIQSVLRRVVKQFLRKILLLGFSISLVFFCTAVVVFGGLEVGFKGVFVGLTLGFEGRIHLELLLNAVL